MRTERRIREAIRAVTNEINGIPGASFDLSDPGIISAFQILKTLKWCCGSRDDSWRNPEGQVARTVQRLRDGAK